MWENAAEAAISVGRHFKRWYTGQITAKMFWDAAGGSIIIVGTSVVGGAGGATTGAAIGMCVGPVGGIIGAIIGGIIGVIAGGKAGKKIAKKVRDNQ